LPRVRGLSGSSSPHPGVFDAILVQLGNGALLAGVGQRRSASLRRKPRIIAVVAANAPAMSSRWSRACHSTGTVNTIADGIESAFAIPARWSCCANAATTSWQWRSTILQALHLVIVGPRADARAGRSGPGSRHPGHAERFRGRRIATLFPAATCRASCAPNCRFASMKFYTKRHSPYARKVLVAAHEMGLQPAAERGSSRTQSDPPQRGGMGAQPAWKSAGC